MTVGEATTRIIAAGYGGLCLWTNGNLIAPKFMACPLNGMMLADIDSRLKPDYSMNLWDWQTDADTAMMELVAKCEAHSR